MENSDKTFSELVKVLKSWIPRGSEPENVSRDFWMPDHSCRVCYDCDTQFTLFNRRHHCRRCGRIFCGKCTSNSIPVLYNVRRDAAEEVDFVRVCNFCYRQWEHEMVSPDPEIRPTLSPSLSATSLMSTKSIGITSVTTTVASFSTGIDWHAQASALSHHDKSFDEKQETIRPRSIISNTDKDVSSSFKFGYYGHKSDDEEDYYGEYHPDMQDHHHHKRSNSYYDQVEFGPLDSCYTKMSETIGEDDSSKMVSSPTVDIEFENSLANGKLEGEIEPDLSSECDPSSSIYIMESKDTEPVDFENNGLLWLPPEPEDEEDEREDNFCDDEEDSVGDWNRLHSSNSFGSGEYRSRDRSCEEHKKAMKEVVDGHFRALIAQLLQVENISVDGEGDKKSWLEIVTSLSWEAANFLKPDTSKGGGMDPCGYVKVKCIACGHRNESMLVKGVVCKKNVAHRRMASHIEKPRLLILGGALEYQRISNLLSSIDTLLQQETDHLKMAVAKIVAQQPNILLVEKTVARYAQNLLLDKDITLVLNIKKPLLERVARCTGAQIVPSIDHLSTQKLGHCELFHVDKFLEHYGSGGDGAKKTLKTLMFFEACPKPLGCTVLLKGTNLNELKKVKHVVQYGIFAAYHLAVETSFLADEGASLPELPLKSPITVALPNKPPGVDSSISVIPGFITMSVDNSDVTNGARSDWPIGGIAEEQPFYSVGNGLKIVDSTCNHGDQTFEAKTSHMGSCNKAEKNTLTSIVSSTAELSSRIKERNKVNFGFCYEAGMSRFDGQDFAHDPNPSSCLVDYRTSEAAHILGESLLKQKNTPLNLNSELSMCQNEESNGELENPSTTDILPPSDHQSILVSLSTRCVWKGTVCERSQLFRIKYYGNFDKPLGRFLRDHLFEQSFRCQSCDMPSEAHVHCYTHRQGSLTISVRKLPEFLLPGERDGKIWMWHRCLRCPRSSSDGFPRATRRVVMSDAAWGLSFGKFLELSFSNHAAASRVASCGHSLHRDCLRFYGFGRMVACFRYASINVHSVYLPPHKLHFGFECQDWIQQEANEVANMARFMFGEIHNAIALVAEKRILQNSVEDLELRGHLNELEGIFQKEKAEFEDSFHRVAKNEVLQGQPAIDILEINKFRRQILFQSFWWDRQLISAAVRCKKSNDPLNSLWQRDREKSLSTERLCDLDKEKNTLMDKPCDMDKVKNHTSDKIPDLDEKIFSTDKLCNLNKENDRSTQNLAYLDMGNGCSTEKLGDLDDVKQVDDSINTPGENLKPCEPLQENVVIAKPKEPLDSNSAACLQTNGTDDSPQLKETKSFLYSSVSVSEHSVPLEPDIVARRTLSDGQFPSISDAFDAKWTGSQDLPATTASMSDSSASGDTAAGSSHLEDTDGQYADNVSLSSSVLFSKIGDAMEDISSWIGIPSLHFYRSFNKNMGIYQRFDFLSEYTPVYISSVRESERQAGPRLLLPVGINDIVIAIHDDEPSSIISYALASHEYHYQLLDEPQRDGPDPWAAIPLSDVRNLRLSQSVDDVSSETLKNLSSAEDTLLSMSSSRSSLALDPLVYTKAMHARVSFSDGPLGKVKYTVTCYYAKSFDALRRICCPSEVDYIRSLSRCKKWGAQGGKSNVFFAKSLDDRFIIKQVTKTELESFIKFAPEYFKYLSESICSKSPTALAKILGIYQVTAKSSKGGKETKMDVLVMENLLFRRHVTRLYDLKGSTRSRYNPDASGTNKVLLDQNLIEAMPTSPIFVGNKAKRLLERAVWNDTSFLASVDVMDYSLLVGVDEEKQELVLGIIDFMRQYTWDKHLETWVKASGILGGPKNVSPTVISPKQYKRRFRKAMSAYFLVVPDQWSPSAAVSSKLGTEGASDEQHTLLA